MKIPCTTKISPKKCSS